MPGVELETKEPAAFQRVSNREASHHKYPEWIVLVVTAGADGQVNVMPAGWSMMASFDPPMYAVSIGHGRYTHELLQATGEFTIAIPGPEMGNAIRYCGSCSGRDGDKVAACGLVTYPAARVRPPLLAGAIVNLECRVVSHVPSGDHTIFLGEIVAAHLADRPSGRLLNFGDGLYALGQPRPGSEFLVES